MEATNIVYVGCTRKDKALTGEIIDQPLEPGFIVLDDEGMAEIRDRVSTLYNTGDFFSVSALHDPHLSGQEGIIFRIHDEM